MLLWERGCTFASRGNEKLQVHSMLSKTRFDQGRSLQKNLKWEQMAQMIQHFRGPLLGFPLSSASRTLSRLLAEMIKPHIIFHSGLNHNSKFSLGPRKIISASNQQEVAWKTMLTFPKKMVYGCLPLFRMLVTSCYG